MYYLWVFSGEVSRAKGYYLPMQENWSGRVDVGRDLFDGTEQLLIAVHAEEGKWTLGLPDGYKWENSNTGWETLESEKSLKAFSERYSVTIVPTAYSRENTIMTKYALTGQSVSIGKDTRNDISYNMQLVSGKHGSISLSGGSVFYEDHSTNGTWINNRWIHGGSVKLCPGDTIHIAPNLQILVFDRFIAVNAPENLKISDQIVLYKLPAAPERAPEDRDIVQEYHRAPRMIQQADTTPITIDPPLERDRNKKMPTWLTIGPSMTMIMPMLVSTVVMGRSMAASLVMIGTSSALSVMWALLNQKYAKQDEQTTEANRQKICRQYFSEIEEQLVAETDREKKRLNMNNLSVTECVKLPYSNNHRMWERLPQHEDFLTMRLGLGETKLPHEIGIQKLKIALIDDPLRHEPQRLKDVYQMMQDAPIVVNPLEHRIIGVLGNKTSPWMLQSMVVQLAASHSYHDVRIIILHDETDKDQWKFAHRLPHVYASDDRTLRLAVSGESAIQEVLAWLDNNLTIRAEKEAAKESNGEEEDTQKKRDISGQIPWYMLFVTDPKLLENQPIMRYLTTPRLGFTLVLQTPEMEALPKECDLIIEARSQRGTVYHSDGTMTGVNYEMVDMNQLQSFARGLSTYRIKEMIGDSALPSLVTFLETFGVRDVNDLNVVQNWNENHAWKAVKSVLGFKSGNTPFILDISDKNHGPHGLIAGTTGAGKSVLLQSFILSLALNYSPTEVQFILIDYKGGGTSEDFKNLPHAAGVIDSLEGERTIFRALASIKGEIKRREAMFKSVGVNSIDDYMKLFNADPQEKPLSHLIIIVDEFAELKKEQPEFMHELVSAARVGRSLGMHLVLATQKPGNSVTDEIDANTRFRICLRVASTSDSNDMLKRPEAAYLRGMGRCYVQVGNNEVFEQVQTSWSGSPYAPEALRPEEEPRILNEAGQPIKFRKKKKTQDGEAKEKSELDAVMEYIQNCCTKYHIEPAPKMWLKEMSKVLLLQETAEYFAVPVFDGSAWPENKNYDELRVLFGMADDVDTQRRLPSVIDFIQDRNVLVTGLTGSGKTILLQTVAVSLAMHYTPAEVQIYAFSLTSHALQCLEGLPHVGDIVYEEDDDEQIRLLNLLIGESERRKKLFRKLGTDNFIQFNKAARDTENMEPVPAWMVLVDRMQQIREWENKRNEEKLDQFYELLRSSASQGIYFVITAYNRNELPAKYHPFVTGLSLQQNSRADYAEALDTRIPIEWGGIREYPGRGVLAVEDKEAKEVRVYEFQTAVYGTADSDQRRGEMIKELASQMKTAWKGVSPLHIPRIPEKPVLADMLAQPTAASPEDRYRLPIGYVKADGSVANLDVHSFYSGIFIGPKHCGKATLLKTLAVTMKQKGYEVYLIGSQNIVEWANTKGIDAYLHGSTEWLSKFNDILTNTIGERSAKLKEARSGGSAKHREVADSFIPLAILIENADKYIEAYASNQSLLDKMVYFVQDSEKIASYKILTYMTVSRSGYQANRLREPLRTAVSVRRGIMLTGVTQDCDPFGVSATMSYQKRGEVYPAGEGLLVTEDGTNRIVLPQLEITDPE